MSTKGNSRTAALQLGAILADENNLPRDLYRRALYLIELQKELTNIVPPPLNRHITVANCSQGLLTIHASSSAWAARLRFKIPELLKHLNSGPANATIQTIRIKVRPDEAAPPPAPAGKPTGVIPVSARSASLLATVAESISDPELSECLLKLSRHRET